jgi:AcrR family transcriptional regulator
MKQVVQVTGLKPGSLYLAFGNKEALFREALQSYAEKGIAHICNTLDNAPSVNAFHEVLLLQSTFHQDHIINTTLALCVSSVNYYKAQLFVVVN